jgi:hypothetical protein
LVYYDRIIEKIIFANNTAIVMGNETNKTWRNSGKCR